ncbi:uncharacterized protein LOC111344918 [Stylophora pistillata]|uniref:uncharacterized protein LOC111344918 n=1 Tax=Stylophora pistillata TaxID=50429 RepID=UPI000C0579B6|nr:uncharacterized protein LOC111344918 [Stylophora pistillata]
MYCVKPFHNYLRGCLIKSKSYVLVVGIAFKNQRRQFPALFTPKGQVMQTVNTGYAVSQMPGGPVAVPMHTVGGMVAVQTVPQGGQPQMVMMPASGAVGGHPQVVHVPTSGAMMGGQTQFVQVAPTGAAASGYQQQQVDVSQSYGQGQYMVLQDEQVPVKT